MSKIKIIIVGKEKLITNFQLNKEKYSTFNDIISSLVNDLANQIEENDKFITFYGTIDNMNIEKINLDKHKRVFEQIIVYEESPNRLTRKILGTIDYEDLI